MTHLLIQLPFKLVAAVQVYGQARCHIPCSCSHVVAEYKGFFCAEECRKLMWLILVCVCLDWSDLWVCHPLHEWQVVRTLQVLVCRAHCSLDS